MKLRELILEKCGFKILGTFVATKSWKGTWYWEGPIWEDGKRLLMFENKRKRSPEDPDMIIYLADKPRFQFSADADVARALREKEEREFQKYLDEDLRGPYREILGGLPKGKKKS